MREEKEKGVEGWRRRRRKGREERRRKQKNSFTRYIFISSFLSVHKSVKLKRSLRSIVSSFNFPFLKTGLHIGATYLLWLEELMVMKKGEGESFPWITGAFHFQYLK